MLKYHNTGLLAPLNLTIDLKGTSFSRHGYLESISSLEERNLHFELYIEVNLHLLWSLTRALSHFLMATSPPCANNFLSITQLQVACRVAYMCQQAMHVPQFFFFFLHSFRFLIYCWDMQCGNEHALYFKIVTNTIYLLVYFYHLPWSVFIT